MVSVTLTLTMLQSDGLDTETFQTVFANTMGVPREVVVIDVLESRRRLADSEATGSSAASGGSVQVVATIRTEHSWLMEQSRDALLQLNQDSSALAAASRALGVQVQAVGEPRVSQEMVLAPPPPPQPPLLPADEWIEREEVDSQILEGAQPEGITVSGNGTFVELVACTFENLRSPEGGRWQDSNSRASSSTSHADL